MAQEFDNTNRGSIWKNDKKESNNHPDFTGSLNVVGVEYWVSAWKRKPDASEKAPALSFSIKLKETNGDTDRKPSKNSSTTKHGAFDNFDDDSIPFAPHGKCGAGVSWRCL